MKPRVKIDWNGWNGTLAGYWWLIEDAEKQAEKQGIEHGPSCYCTACLESRARAMRKVKRPEAS